jgi:uncharacterized protein (DUF2249 family)
LRTSRPPAPTEEEEIVTATLPPGAAADVVLASDAGDAAALETIRQHHAELAGRLAAHVGVLMSAPSALDGTSPAQARAATLQFAMGELLPHAAAEERAIYSVAARSEPLRLLVEAMAGEHRVLERLVLDLGSAADPVRAAAIGWALRVLFDTHLEKENELLLPALATDPTVSLAELLVRMHEALDDHAQDAEHAAHGVGAAPAPGSCGCGGHDDADVPVLDVRAVPHAIRHATVFGAFDAIPDGGSLLLVAPHDPLPLLRQLSARAGGALAVDYEERGPEAWRLRLTRV